jgi:site-specific recombinase XerD
MAAVYHDEKRAAHIKRLRALLGELPPFLGQYFMTLSDQTEALTRLGYAYDLRIFFNYMSEEIFPRKPLVDYTIEDMREIEAHHLQAFMEYLTFYIPQKGETVQNAALGKSRKLAAVRKLFRWLYMQKKLPANPAELVSFPKINNKAIVTLEVDEIAKLLDEVDSGEKLSPRQRAFHERTKLRDAAIITLLLGTGMRVSECIGIDLGDIDFEVGGIRVRRKGGDEMILYFGAEVEEALKRYIETRAGMVPLAGHENALFLSLQNRRITDRAIQNMVKKYASLITRLKNISPHKLRSTFGTQLYRETGDIYVVADVLGHSDVNTTKKHYAAMSEDIRRDAAKRVRVRD